MIRATSIALFVFLVALTVVLLGLGYDAHRLLVHLDGSSAVLLQRWTPGKGKPDALIDAAYNFLHATNDNLNRSCGGEKPCGTLATINKAVTKAGDSLVTTQLAERSTVPHVLAAMDAFRDSAARLGGTADAASTALGTANTTIQQMQPLTASLRRSVEDFDALVTAPDWLSALHHVDGMAASGDGILADARRVADKETADWLKPVPWWKQPIKKGGQLIDITAAIARHTP
ncbi:MAG: hypothetical protein KGL39_18435 [Patescibacteria group bacterium]|nr:hypothetical protein [Patescibacteria group bacterium]